jgi:hypothetical protein
MQISSKLLGIGHWQGHLKVLQIWPTFLKKSISSTFASKLKEKRREYIERTKSRKLEIYPNSSRTFWTSISPIEGGRPSFFALLRFAHE